MLMEFGGLSTPLVADACVRTGVPLRVAPPGIGAVIPGQRIAGRALRPATTAALMCSWKPSAAQRMATSWSSTTAGGKMRRASAIWSCWRHKRQGSAE